MTATTIQTDTAAAGKAIAPLKAKAAAVVPMPINASKDIPLPGGNTVSPAGDRRVNLVMKPPNGLKAMGGSDWPAFNQVLLEGVMATLRTTNPDDAANRTAAASIALAAFKPTDEVEGMIAGQCVALHH